ncbi:MAG: hypothetical protein NC548_42570 [Lachnospiraceae bacterium]|nr:hypothetical protein [Lachnospiraceae bacterium]
MISLTQSRKNTQCGGVKYFKFDKYMSTEKTEGGVSILFLLFVIFLVLKLTNTITWSWWIVTLPLWIGFAFGLGIVGIALSLLILVGIIIGLYFLIAWIYEKVRK